MRILFTTTPGWGHVHPIVPLARAFRARGDEVLWATGVETCGRLRSEGFEASAAGLDVRASLERVAHRFPELASLPPLERSGPMFTRIFADVRAPAMLADLLPLVRDWRPSVVIHDAAEFAAPVAAAVAGVPSVSHSFGRLMPAQITAEAGEALASLWARQGLAAPPHAGLYQYLYVDIYPPSLQTTKIAHVPTVQSLRPVTFALGRAGALPEWVTLEASQPLVYVTFGTVLATDVSLLSIVVEALSELPVRVLVSVGPDRDPALLGDQPPNVHVTSYIAQTQLLPYCAAVVSHAGSGVFLAALAHGRPQLCLPQFADQFLNAAVCVRCGAGLALPPETVTAPAVRAAAEQLLSNAQLRAAATTVAQEISQMPEPLEVAQHIGDRFG